MASSVMQVEEVHGCRMIVDGDRCVAHWREGGFENASIEWWQRQNFEGRTVLDVGAYTGLYSILAAKRGARVFAFEPLVRNATRFARNVAMNHCEFVTMIASAASDRQGDASFSYNDKVPLTSGGSLVQRGRPGHSEIFVRTVMIDALALRNVAAMKIDVERNEPAVIRGAMQTIERCKPHLLVETLDVEMRDAISKLLPAYRVAAILDRNTLYSPL